MSQDLKKTNEVKIAGVFSQQQITPTFSKQVILINAKDTRDNQWKTADMEIYIKPDLLAQAGVGIGDTILLTGWLAFNFWNGRSFPRIVATSVQLIEKAQGGQQAQPTAGNVQDQQFNSPQQVPQAPQTPQTPGVQAPGMGGPQAPSIPQVPNVPQTPQAPQVPGM
jgi:hypothetical protein